MTETTRNITVLMGEYIIIKKGSNEKIIIESPEIENCVVVVLESPQGIAIAHLDTHLVATATINKITSRLKSMKNKIEENVITATLFGGIAGFSFCRYKVIYKAIYKALEEHEIPYKHLEYSYCTPLGSVPGITSTLYIGLQYFGLIPTLISYPLTLPALSGIALFFTLSCVVECAIDKRLLRTYDIKIMLEANKTTINTTINNKMNSTRIFNNAPQERLQYLFDTRTKLNPNPRTPSSDSIDALQLRDISDNPYSSKFKLKGR